MTSETLKTLNEIEGYVKFLIYDRKLEIALCDSALPSEYLKKLSLYTVHANSYCQKIKNANGGQRHCLLMQKFVRKKCKEKRPFFGTCYAGVAEFVFPIWEEEHYIGFISVSGYKSDVKKTRFTTKEREFSLKSTIPTMQELERLLAPLVNCFRLLFLHVEKSPKTEKARGQDRVYEKILAYLSENFLQRLTLLEIAEALHYSPSYLAHLFQEKSGTPLMRYVCELKIEKAKELLRTTDMTVSQISETVGFEDSNYFTAVFKKKVGFSPRKYKNL